jgi:hypothetical protein
MARTARFRDFPRLTLSRYGGGLLPAIQLAIAANHEERRAKKQKPGASPEPISILR